MGSRLTALITMYRSPVPQMSRHLEKWHVHSHLLEGV